MFYLTCFINLIFNSLGAGENCGGIKKPLRKSCHLSHGIIPRFLGSAVYRGIQVERGRQIFTLYIPENFLLCAEIWPTGEHGKTFCFSQFIKLNQARNCEPPLLGQAGPVDRISCIRCTRSRLSQVTFAERGEGGHWASKQMSSFQSIWTCYIAKLFVFWLTPPPPVCLTGLYP